MNLVVFGSGRGSNFKAIVSAINNGTLNVKVSCVVVNIAKAQMIKIAKNNNIPVILVENKNKSREQHEKEILSELNKYNFDLVVLAGYMRVLSAEFIKKIAKPIINIHPSLLPCFKGLHAQRQALEYGVKYSGCTVHLVNENVDAGKILGQAVVPVFPDDTEDTLSARILVEEHKLYPRIIQQIVDGEIKI